jgi:hypothetical protein
MKEKKEINPETKRKNLSFFLMIFPSVLLAIIPQTFGENVIYPLVVKMLILIYQYFIIQNFVESVYN